ncbi:MAG: hypothetical protein LBC94_03885 [Desulfovibrio sp.]|nr:hypothetical protein [Desulfovibrio sp.]
MFFLLIVCASLGVGGAHGDAIRQITGDITRLRYGPIIGVSTGPFTNTPGVSTEYMVTSGSQKSSLLAMNISRVVPTAAKNQPRAWGALACVYLGAPK